MFRTQLMLFTALSLSALGCSNGELSVDQSGSKTPPTGPVTAHQLVIESPLEGAVIAADSIDVSGSVVGLDGVTINGTTVDVTDGRFSHTLLLPTSGVFAIVVGAGEGSMARNITIDRSGPTLNIISPTRGMALDRTSGGSITVTGTAVDPAGVAQVAVNGQSVSPDPSGAFTATVPATPGVNLIQIDAEDTTGLKTRDVRAVIYGDFEPFATPVDDAITVRLERDALRIAGEALGASITPDLFANIGGAVQEGDFQVRGVTMGGVEVDLIPGNGVLTIELKVYDLQLDFAANFNGSSIRGDVNAHPAIIRLGLRIDTDGLGGLDLSIVNAEAEMEDFDFDVNGLLGLFDWLIRGIVRDKLEEGLADALSGQVINDILEADALNQVGELLGHPAAYALALTHIGVDPNGIDITLDAGIEVTEANLNRLPGYFSTPATAPRSEDSQMIRFSLADDYLNMLLAQVWQVSGLRVDLGALLAGLEEGTLPLELNAAGVAALVGAPTLLDHTEADSKIGLVLETKAPPLVQAFGGANKKVQIDVPEMQLTFSYPSAEGQVVWAVIVVHVGIHLTRDAEDKLAFEITSAIDLVDAPAFPLVEEDVASALGGLFAIIPGLIASAGDAEGEGEGGGILGGLGNLGGLGSANPGVVVDDFQMRIGGDDGGYLNFGLELGVKLVPDEAPALAIIQTEVSPINGRTYHLLEPSSWSDAEAAARALGGHLATIRNRDEDRWILDTFGEMDRENRDLWIGLNDATREGQWEWSSGEPVDYENFDRKQPDNGIEEENSGLNEDYVHVYGDRSPRRDGKWNDAKDVSQAEYNEGFYGVVEVFEAPPAGDAEAPQGDADEGN